VLLFTFILSGKIPIDLPLIECRLGFDAIVVLQAENWILKQKHTLFLKKTHNF